MYTTYATECCNAILACFTCLHPLCKISNYLQLFFQHKLLAESAISLFSSCCFSACWITHFGGQTLFIFPVLLFFLNFHQISFSGHKPSYLNHVFEGVKLRCDVFCFWALIILLHCKRESWCWGESVGSKKWEELNEKWNEIFSTLILHWTRKMAVFLLNLFVNLMWDLATELLVDLCAWVASWRRNVMKHIYFLAWNKIKYWDFSRHPCDLKTLFLAFVTFMYFMTFFGWCLRDLCFTCFHYIVLHSTDDSKAWSHTEHIFRTFNNKIPRTLNTFSLYYWVAVTTNLFLWQITKMHGNNFRYQAWNLNFEIGTINISQLI